MQVVGYTRCSTEGQADSGLGLDAQRSKVEGMVSLHDWTLTELVTDAGASGKTLDRDGMARVLELVKARAVDAVVVAKLDRLTRSVRDLADLVETFRRHGVALVSVSESINTSTAAGRMVLNMLGTVAEWERDTLSERTRDALAAKAAKGERVSGRLPYGFRLAADGVHLEADPQERATLAAARRFRADGLSYRKVVTALTNAGHVSRTGRPFGVRQVWNMVNGSTDAGAVRVAA